MRLIELSYGRYLAEYPDRDRLREINECVVWTAGTHPRLIILDDPVSRTVAVFEYDSPEEFETDRNLVLRIDSGGDSGAGLPAWLRPDGPARSAGAAEPRPSLKPEDL